MAILYFVTALLFFVIVVFMLYIPLPPTIADRKKLQFFEIFMRLGNIYGGDIIEFICGCQARNSYLRFLIRICFLFPQPVPIFVKLHNDRIKGVSVRVYIPVNRKSKASLIFFHGGGWTTMRPSYYDAFIFSLIRRLGITVFSVDYRLAPEHPFPKPLEDCEAVVNELYNCKWVDYDIDRSRISIMGDSAGGNLSAVIAQRFARKGQHFLKCQVLIYPVTHVFSFQSPSYLAYYKHYNGTGLINPQIIARSILLYIGEDACKSNIQKLLQNQHVSRELQSSTELTKLFSLQMPEKIGRKKESYTDSKKDSYLCSIFDQMGINPDLSPIFGIRGDLPPAMVLTVEYDVLRDEGIQYAKRLEESGVQTEWKHYANAFHGQCNVPFSSLRREMVRDIAAYLSTHM